MYSLITDAELEEELLQGFKQRSLDQKSLYIQEGAKIYYETVDEKTSTKGKEMVGNWIEKLEMIQTQNKLNFFPNGENLKNFMKDRSYWKYPCCLISLGCGNGGQEKPLLEELEKDCAELNYLWVDSSKEMLLLAEKNLQNISIPKEFIQADFTQKKFSQDINHRTKNKEIRIFALLWSTLWNPNQTEIISSLHNMMGENDLLWFDISTREKITEENTQTMINEYRAMLSEPSIQRRNLRLLKKYGLNIDEDGKLDLAIGKEEERGITLLKYYYKFRKDTKLTIANENLTFLADDRITLLHIRNYHTPKFLEFMDKMGFKLFDLQKQKDTEVATITQFLFAKK